MTRGPALYAGDLAMRAAGGLAIVAAAAVIAFAAGGDHLFGGLGSLFGSRGGGLEVAKRGTHAEAGVVAAPTAAARRAAARAGRQPVTAKPRPTHDRRRSGTGHRAPRNNGAPTAPVGGQPAPQESPVPTLPPPGPAPGPGNGQTVSAVGNTVKGVTQKAPPQATPLTKPVDDVVDTLVQTCQGLPVCP